MGCGVCDTPELWRGVAGLCARVRACAGTAESLHTYVHILHTALRCSLGHNVSATLLAEAFEPLCSVANLYIRTHTAHCTPVLTIEYPQHCLRKLSSLLAPSHMPSSSTRAAESLHTYYILLTALQCSLGHKVSTALLAEAFQFSRSVAYALQFESLHTYTYCTLHSSAHSAIKYPQHCLRKLSSFLAPSHTPFSSTRADPVRSVGQRCFLAASRILLDLNSLSDSGASSSGT